MHSDVLIVGGGLSGLALADQLEQQGVHWQLVEATDQLGGRIRSPNIHGENFDLGPAWFWPGQPRIAQCKAAQACGVPFELPGACTVLSMQSVKACRPKKFICLHR